jgi:NAD-reducing hydrogenase large subunit
LYEHLETAENPEGLRRVVVDPISRVEGHGKITLLMDENHEVRQARLHIVEFRGFERFIEGRPYWELPVLVQRLCGICPVSHHLAAAKAIDQIVGVDQLTPSAEKIRRLMHYAQVLQSHALHFFHLASPDLLFGYDSELGRRNIFGVLAQFPDIALQGIELRKFGQEVIRCLTGKRIHGTSAIPGGVNKHLSRLDRDHLIAWAPSIVVAAKKAEELSKRLFLSDPRHQSFATIQSNYLSLNREDGAMDLYHGGLWLKDQSGKLLLRNIDYRTYADLLREEVKSWTYMKFPFVESMGSSEGWYRVGPLARLNNAAEIDTPMAEAARRDFISLAGGRPLSATLGYHWARMIELLHCAETVQLLLDDEDVLRGSLTTVGEARPEGIGVIEAPRGTLFHHYQVDEQGLVTRANLIVSTTNNNQAMNESVRQVASCYLDGHEPDEGLLNHLEVAIRAYDPCLSCATHALGKMPLELEILNPNGERSFHISRNVSDATSSI